MNGILLVDKPQGWTSFDVAAKLKGLCHTRRVGHSGTLDPLATGLLVMFIGRATRAVSFAEGQNKRYIASMRLGLVTDTQDITGNVTGEHEQHVTNGEIESVLGSFHGEIMQIPPMYSAIKQNGRRLYDIARRGGEVERAPRPVTIKTLDLLGRDDRGDIILDVECSKGTYVRTLCDDIGRALGCGACMSALRRTRVGAFRVEDAHTVDELIARADEGTLEELLLGVDVLFEELERISVSQEQEKIVRCGGSFRLDRPNGRYRVYSADGTFLMLGEAADGTLRTIKSFFEV